MSWNESEKEDKKSTGENRQAKGPPDLDQLVQKLARKLKRTTFGGGSGGFSPDKSVSFIVSLVAAIVFIIWLLSGIFIVGPADEAVVLRFGRYLETMGPGPHWIPQFIDSKYVVNIKKVDSFELKSDFLTKSSDQRDKQQAQLIDVSLIKGKKTLSNAPSDVDKNVVYVEMSVQYRVGNPRQYLFNVVAARIVLQNAARSALSQAIGEMKLDEVLTRGREQLGIEVSKRLETLMESYGTGITVRTVNVRKAQAPEEVADAFLDVAQAGQDEQRYIQQAEAYASKVVPLAQGVALRMKADAKAYQQAVILNSKAVVAKYLALLKVYQKKPDVTRDRLYLDAMQFVFEHTSKLLVAMKGSNNMLYLPVDQMMRHGVKQFEKTRETEQIQSEEPVMSAAKEEANLMPSVYAPYSVRDRFTNARKGRN
jgi:membrane protease subunit HflK